MRKDVYEYYTETNGKFSNHLSLPSIHFERFGNYKNDWELRDIVFFDAMLVLSRKYGNRKFYMQQDRLKDYTRLSRHHLKKAEKKLKRFGFLEVTRDGKRHRNRYEVKYDVIKDNLELIYDFSEVPREDIKPVKDYFKIMYTYQADNGYSKKNTENNNRELLIAEDVSDEEVEEVGFSEEFLSELRSSEEGQNSDVDDTPD